MLRSRNDRVRSIGVRFRPPVRALLAVVLLAAWLSQPGIARTDPVTASATFTNPLRVAPTAAGPFESCPDPAVIRGQQAGDDLWYLYCTSNPLNGTDHVTHGRPLTHFLPMLRSRDLVNWEYMGDAFSERPAWFGGFGSFWAPDIQFFNDRYYLYYTASPSPFGRGGAIGVATAPGPLGPWTESGGPVVEPQGDPCCARSRRWVYDPAVVTDAAGQRYLFYGSFVGGISARRLAADGLHTDPATETPIAAANRYEGVAVVRHGGFYYLFASAGECCNGPVSGYSVFVGRSPDLLGPYVDRDGIALLADRVGGTPVLGAGGNRWVGPGHNTVVTDRAGQDWLLYHAVDRDDPYFAQTTMTKRPLLLDPLDWVGGWPLVRGGLGPSDTPQQVPAAQPGDAPRSPLEPARPETLGPLDAARSVAFDALPPGPVGATPAFPALPAGAWHWIRTPDAESVAVAGGALRFRTQAGNLDDHSAAILAAPMPAGEYAIETRVRLDLPPGSGPTGVQAGLVIYGDDGGYLKLANIAREQTRQVVFAKGEMPVPRIPREGNIAVGTPAEWTYLRIVKRIRSGEENYTAYSSRDGLQWTRGGTWTERQGWQARIGLVAMGGTGYMADFAYLRIYALPPR